MSNPTYFSKTLAAQSSAGIGTLSSASPGVATLNTSALDTQRRIIIWSSGATLASASFTITGTRQGAGVVSETITGPTSGGGATPTVATTQDFLSVTAVSASSVIANTATFGTNTQGGSPWQSVNVHVTPVQIGGQMVFSSVTVGNLGSIEYTMDNPFLAPPVQAPGGMPYPINAQPIAFISTTFSSAAANTINAINAIGQALLVPITAWRLTMTSSTASGSISVTAIQAGIG